MKKKSEEKKVMLVGHTRDRPYFGKCEMMKEKKISMWMAKKKLWKIKENAGLLHCEVNENNDKWSIFCEVNNGVGGTMAYAAAREQRTFFLFISNNGSSGKPNQACGNIKRCLRFLRYVPFYILYLKTTHNENFLSWRHSWWVRKKWHYIL